MFAAVLANSGVDISLPTLVIGCGVAAYVVSLARNWRPINALREENKGLRTDLNAANDRIHDLELEVEHWKQATDLTVLQREHREFADVLARVVKHLDRLDHSVKANTAAVELVVKASAIGDALDDRAA